MKECKHCGQEITGEDYFSGVEGDFCSGECLDDYMAINGFAEGSETEHD